MAEFVIPIHKNKINKKMLSLTQKEILVLDWLPEFKLYRHGVLPDGHCLIHSILFLASRTYHQHPNQKKILAVKSRRALADEIKKRYNELARGKLKELSMEVSDMKLSNLVKKYNSSRSLGHEDLELISDYLNMDIYVIESKTNDISYSLKSDRDILYKKRDSIIIYHLQNHFEPITLFNEGKHHTMFKPGHVLIQRLKKRLG